MKILTLQDDLFLYLQHVIKAYAGGGIDPEEGLGLYHLSQVLKTARTIDESQVAKVGTGYVNGTPAAVVSVGDVAEQPPDQA